jgi:hypothetical protein
MSINAYPLAWATADAVRAATAAWQKRGLLTPAQQVAIDAAHPRSYYRPNVWIRVLLLLSTALGIATALGFSVLLTAAKLSPAVYGGLVLVGAVIVLELVISGSAHYRSGVDNALLYSAVVAWAFLASELSEHLVANSAGNICWLLLMLPLLLAALVRYADPLVAAASFAAAFALLANVLLQSNLGRMLLPFGIMVAAIALLRALRRLPLRDDYFYYRSTELVLRTMGLAVLYLAGNYLVVREGNAQLLGGGSPSVQIPLAPLFYACTAGIPLVYIGLGLRRHDRLLLTLGLLALAFSIFTLRQYRSLLPPEIAATVGGTVLLLGALAALRYLRTPRHGLTAAADAEAHPHFNLESLVVAETAHAPAVPTETGFQFGGGQSGGGGADSSY